MMNSNSKILDQGVPSPVPSLAWQMQPGLRKLVHEYGDFSTQLELSIADIQRMTEISALAEYDDELNNWLTAIDENLELIFMAQEFKKEPFSLEDFILEIQHIPPHEMTFEKFKEIAQKVYISDRLLAQHIHFQESEYSRQTICQTAFGAIFVIAWMPGQHCGPHKHSPDDLSVIRVCQGELTHRIYEETSTFHRGQPGYRPIQEKTERFKENEWIGVDVSEVHELANESSEKIVTLHFRFFSSPIKHEGQEHTWLDRQPILSSER